jgi:hypothetical protein
MLLNAHYGFGFLLVALALAAIFWRPARRYVMWALVVQIVLGGIVWLRGGVAPPPVHWVLAILDGGVYAMANAFERRGRPQGVVVGTLVLGFAIFAIIFSIGMSAVRG